MGNSDQNSETGIVPDYEANQIVAKTNIQIAYQAYEQDEAGYLPQHRHKDVF